jgi:hypothetical protein
LQFLDATFFGGEQKVELEVNEQFQGRQDGVPTSSPAHESGAGGTGSNSLRFVYQGLARNPEVSRPVIPLRLTGRTGSKEIPQAYVDTGSVEVMVPLSSTEEIGVHFEDNGTLKMRWKGVPTLVRFGEVELRMSDGRFTCTWSALVRFIDAELPVPLLGHFGFLQYLNATFRGAKRVLELELNRDFRGSIVGPAPTSSTP